MKIGILRRLSGALIITLSTVAVAITVNLATTGGADWWVFALLVAAILTATLVLIYGPSVESIARSRRYSLSTRLGGDIVPLPPAFPDVNRPTNGIGFFAGQAYYFKRDALSASDLSPAPTSPSGTDGTHAWAVSNGGLDYRRTVGDVVITAYEPIAIRGAFVLSTRQPIDPGDLAATPIGGTLPTHHLSIDLPSSSVEMVRIDGDVGSVAESYALQFQLAIGESERIAFIAKADTDDLVKFEWSLKLDAIINGVERTIIIDDNGAPFKLVAKGGSHHRERIYDRETQLWTSYAMD